jgi:hypothetical protein
LSALFSKRMKRSILSCQNNTKVIRNIIDSYSKNSTAQFVCHERYFSPQRIKTGWLCNEKKTNKQRNAISDLKFPCEHKLRTDYS